MKTTLIQSITLCLGLAVSGLQTAKADNIVIENGDWKITYIETNKAFRINHKKADGSYRPVIINSIPEASYNLIGKDTKTVTTASFAQMSYQAVEIEDEFGKGIDHRFSFGENSDDKGLIMQQSFRLYPEQEYIISALSLIHPDTLESNYLAPICTGSSAYTMYVNNSNNRMLRVPFDNDGFGRYGRHRIDGEINSYEVTAIYEGESRVGLIVGSVDHNLWKSAINIKGANNGKINALKAFSGVSNSETRDLIPHGKVLGDTVSSARMFIGFYQDWRDGMEAFCAANNLVVPKRATWTAGTPFGWQSWGVMAQNNSYDTDIEISDFYHETLQANGFANSQGNIIFSLDAGDGMNDSQHKSFVEHAKKNGQMVGCYSTPFSLWWQDHELDRHIYTGSDGTQYTMRDVVLHVNGKPHKYDGAFCRDPTHPATKADINKSMRAAATYGFKYIKCDFTNCGIIQADSYYDKNVKTAVEAYNQGMQYMIKQADKYGLFIAFSISPLFPYQYANSRRIACDSWGNIGWSEYSMNAITAGWWTDGLYQYNDPDHLVMIGNGDQKNCTLGENRARYTNGAVTGMMLMADNFSLNDKSGCGDAKLSRQRAHQIMLNKDINEMADMGRSFRPVYGYNEYNGYADAAESFVMYHSERYLYVAIINYRASELKGKLPLNLLDIQTGEFSEVKELWSGNIINIENEALPYQVPAKDACVYRFDKQKASGIVEEEKPADMAVLKRLEDGNISVQSNLPIKCIDVLSATGALHTSHTFGEQGCFYISQAPKPCIARIIYDNGVTETHKIP